MGAFFLIFLLFYLEKLISLIFNEFTPALRRFIFCDETKKWKIFSLEILLLLFFFYFYFFGLLCKKAFFSPAVQKSSTSSLGEKENMSWKCLRTNWMYFLEFLDKLEVSETQTVNFKHGFFILKFIFVLVIFRY